MINRKIISSVLESNTIPQDSTVILGLSGGPDSLCLLHVLDQLSDAMNIKIVPVHVNHKLRGKKADEEQDNVVRICDKMGLDCMVFEAECAELAKDMQVSTEEAGRIIRYEIFDEVADSFVTDDKEQENKIVIATAHNADDQSETVLFRLIRGTGVHGLSGISMSRYSDAGYVIVRPLLEVPRVDIEAYIEANNLKPNKDESNEETDYTRNKIRLKLIPYLEKNYNPSIKEALRRYATIAEIDDNFMEEIAYNACLEDMTIEQDKVVLRLENLRDMHVAINRRIVSIALAQVGLQEGVSFEIVANMIALFYSDNPSAQIDLPGGFVACREYDNLVIEKASEREVKDPCEGLRLMPQIMRKREFKPIEGELYAAFDYDAFNEAYPGRVGELALRTRREGDFIAMKDGKSKKFQDFLVDSKIKKADRDKIIVAAIGSEILWIIPCNYLPTKVLREKGRFSQNYQINDTTERVLFLEIVDSL